MDLFATWHPYKGFDNFAKNSYKQFKVRKHFIWGAKWEKEYSKGAK